MAVWTMTAADVRAGSWRARSRVAVSVVILLTGACGQFAPRAADVNTADEMTDNVTTAGASVGRQAYPVVRVALGEAVRDAQQRSTVKFPAVYDTLHANYNITDPVALEIGRAPDVLLLPPGRFTALIPRAGHVVEVRVSPHLKSLTTDDALALVRELEQLLQSHGWRVTTTYATPDSVRHASAATAGSDVFSQSLQEWGRDDDRVTLTLKRTRSLLPTRPWDGHGPTPSRPDDRFIVDVRFFNEPILHRYDSLDAQL